MSQAIVEEIKKRNEEEIELLKKALVRLGTKQADGSITVKFGTVFKDDIVANTFEGVAATLKNAKAKKIVSYNSPLLLQGAHDNVDIILNKEHIPTEESQ